ncbi:MAG TPA: pitrilysin family protein [Candidatus Dormibacteraeota bacterium]|nr:pitrilysin family protein [Candidatus Dormibacteraeota bacterium]
MPSRAAHTVTRRDDGARVISAPMRERASASIALMVAAGSRHEPGDRAGLAHFIEHMAFKGADLHPDARAISEAIEGVGGVLNAATDKEMTMFWAKVPAEHLDLAAAVIGDMVWHSRFDPVEIAKERDVVVEELRMSLDNPQEWVGTLFEEVMWPGHALGRDTGGTEDSVRTLDREDCLRFVREQYRPDSTVVTVAGAVEAAAAEEAGARALGRWGEAAVAAAAPEPAADLPRNGSRVRVVNKRTEQANLCFGARSRSYQDEDRFGVDVMTTILGDGMSSRLFLQLREELGLAYDVHAFTVKHRDSGALGIYVGCEPRRADAAMAAAIAELERLATEPVPERELQKVRAYLTGRLRVQLEGTSSFCTFLGQQELLNGEIMEPDEVVRRIEAVSAEDVRRLAAETLEAGLVGAVIGPFTKPDKFEKRLALS